MLMLLSGNGLRYHENAIDPGAQTACSGEVVVGVPSTDHSTLSTGRAKKSLQKAHRSTIEPEAVTAPTARSSSQTI